MAIIEALNFFVRPGLKAKSAPLTIMDPTETV